MKGIFLSMYCIQIVVLFKHLLEAYSELESLSYSSCIFIHVKYFNPQTTLMKEHCYNRHFTDEETEA